MREKATAYSLAALLAAAFTFAGCKTKALRNPTLPEVVQKVEAARTAEPAKPKKPAKKQPWRKKDVAHIVPLEKRKSSQPITFPVPADYRKRFSVKTKEGMAIVRHIYERLSGRQFEKLPITFVEKKMKESEAVRARYKGPLEAVLSLHLIWPSGREEIFVSTAGRPFPFSAIFHEIGLYHFMHAYAGNRDMLLKETAAMLFETAAFEELASLRGVDYRFKEMRGDLALYWPKTPKLAERADKAAMKNWKMDYRFDESALLAGDLAYIFGSISKAYNFINQAKIANIGRLIEEVRRLPGMKKEHLLILRTIPLLRDKKFRQSLDLLKKADSIYGFERSLLYFEGQAPILSVSLETILRTKLRQLKQRQAREQMRRPKRAPKKTKPKKERIAERKVVHRRRRYV